MPNAKTCVSCSRTEPDVKFSATHKRCNQCRNASLDPEKQREAWRRYREKDPDKHRNRVRQYREENPHMAFYTTSRYQASKAQAHTDLTQKDALEIYNTPNICAYCGADHGETPSKRAVHVDHIIPMVQGGHNSRWNLTKVCNGCNTSKGPASLIDFFERSPEFTQVRFDAVVAEMVRLSGKSTEEITQLLEQSHSFELAFQSERERMVELLAA